MKIQEASEDITEGGIMFLSSKTSYNEEYTSTGEKKENRQKSTEAPIAPPGALGPLENSTKALGASQGAGHLSLAVTCTSNLASGTKRPKTCIVYLR